MVRPKFSVSLDPLVFKGTTKSPVSTLLDLLDSPSVVDQTVIHNSSLRFFTGTWMKT